MFEGSFQSDEEGGPSLRRVREGLNAVDAEEDLVEDLGQVLPHGAGEAGDLGVLRSWGGTFLSATGVYAVLRNASHAT